MKKLKLFVLYFMKILGLFNFMRWKTRRGVRILCYHGIWLGGEGYPGDGMFMKQSTFEARLDCLQKWQFPIIPLDKAITDFSKNELQSCPVVITIDDGWYGTYAAMLPALKHRGMQATLYCDTAHLLTRHAVPHVMARYIRLLVEHGYVGSTRVLSEAQKELYENAILQSGDTVERLNKVRIFALSVSFDFDNYIDNKVFNYMLPEQLKEAHSAGLDVQLHTHNHSMHDMSETAFVKEIDENRFYLSQTLETSTESFKHYCYPSGCYSRSLDGVIRGIGIESSTTTEQSIAYPGTNMQFLPRILDGENVSALEFEAELCGVMDFLRKFRKINNTCENV